MAPKPHYTPFFLAFADSSHDHEICCLSVCISLSPFLPSYHQNLIRRDNSKMMSDFHFSGTMDKGKRREKRCDV